MVVKNFWESEFFKQNWFKIFLLIIATVLVALYGFDKYTTWNKQKAQILLDEQKQQQEQELEKSIEQARIEREEREYIAERKKDCYEIYEKERDAYTNVLYQEYIEEDDICRITYEAKHGEWDGIDCEEIRLEYNEKFPELYDYSFRRYINCTENQFNKEF